ncbi:hypothetical protein [Pelagicoccus sp. SDUM812002]|uniref:hypothetical protein n=1 Tax=Pelagicoccus sp. SDUM812002 TaxID=3041266 RepID=UPI00280F020B|nr:hypothetical protein [Pelagicoccus sp. SDUM812002]MDQ8187593.1 hypothetical protein [Pelagicoccus sp. SDUM812002]
MALLASLSPMWAAWLGMGLSRHAFCDWAFMLFLHLLLFVYSLLFSFSANQSEGVGATGTASGELGFGEVVGAVEEYLDEFGFAVVAKSMKLRLSKVKRLRIALYTTFSLESTGLTETVRESELLSTQFW